MTAVLKKKLTASLEDYLETILNLIGQAGRARVRDIAEHLGVGKPAVTAALKTLARKNLVNYAPYKAISLTAQGKKFATEVQHRHAVLQDFLTEVLGLPEDTAEANACRMEHAIDKMVLQRMTDLARYIRQAPPAKRKWIEDFARQGTENASEPASPKKEMS
ncbi:MAG: metal-dependent transcriptional regulator [Phycisphaerae bacterium]|nr:metal-dependent transcriptional regulator [Phycisphaerae bacterium]